MGNGSLFLKILPSKQNDIFWTMEKVVSKLDAYKTNEPLLSGQSKYFFDKKLLENENKLFGFD